MARRSFDVRQVVEIYEHWAQGTGVRRIARSLGLDRNTVRKYIARATEAGIKQDGTKKSHEEWVAWVHTQDGPRESVENGDAFARIGVFHQRIADGLRGEGEKRMTGKTIWSRLCAEQGLAASYSSFKRYLWTCFREEMLRRCVTVRRADPPPGEEAQIDFTRLGYWMNPATGKKQLLHAFSMVLAYSRHMFVRVVTKMDSETWIRCHVEAFKYFGGVPSRLVIDNLKDGVVKPDQYDPLLNRTYAEMAHHYHAIVDPCRGYHAKDKPRVERPNPYIRDSFFAGREFRSVDEWNVAAIDWCTNVAGARDHGTTRERPMDRFMIVEKAALAPLPAEPYEIATWSRPKLHPDCTVMVNGARYTAPYRLIGETLDVRSTWNTVEIFRNERMIRMHMRHPKGRISINEEDYPPDKIAFYMRNPQFCLRKAGEIGSAAREAVEALLRHKATHNLRQSQGIIGLAEKYGAGRVNAAARRALDFGDPSYQTIKTIVEKGVEEKTKPESDENQLPLDAAFLRGAEEIAGVTS